MSYNPHMWNDLFIKSNGQFVVNNKITILIFFLLFSFLGCNRNEDVVSWKDAADHYGEYRTVEGIVVTTYRSEKAIFLNFHPDYKNHFTTVIFVSDWSNFNEQPEIYYHNKKVRITGKIKEYKGKPEIIVKNKDQIKIIR